ncbi:hypothetical protein CVT26_005417 [Gymnopilus dilepis]|uniref:Uncharacterized protein n=1 Tax=Gymnopilus dilepis TaxID=231916 RepID=A0A409WGJ2_9AGAR|nr:hypothetical protein CVT26_005417 [Gymnopilus dilepis]
MYRSRPKRKTLPSSSRLAELWLSTIATAKQWGHSRLREVASKLQVGHHSSWIASSSDYPGYVWTGLEQADGRIVTPEVVGRVPTSRGKKCPTHTKYICKRNIYGKLFVADLGADKALGLTKIRDDS